MTEIRCNTCLIVNSNNRTQRKDLKKENIIEGFVALLKVSLKCFPFPRHFSEEFTIK